eukprot:749410-Hanusia_phi.AAC.1
MDETIQIHIDEHVLQQVDSDEIFIRNPLCMSKVEFRAFKDVQDLIASLQRKFNFQTSSEALQLCRADSERTEICDLDFDICGKCDLLLLFKDNNSFQSSSWIDTTPNKERTIDSLVANTTALIAFGEFFDNSFQYLLSDKDNHVKRIHCELNFDEGTLLIEDNGAGCADPLQMLVIGSERTPSNGSFDPTCRSFERYLCGMFSRYGIGSKVACNALGEQYTISSKTRDSVVRTVKEFKKDKWKALKSVGSYDEQAVGVSFCRIEIQKLKTHLLSGDCEQFSQETWQLCLQNLLGIYYMYLGDEQAGSKRFASKVLNEIAKTCMFQKIMNDNAVTEAERVIKADMEKVKSMLRGSATKNRSDYDKFDVSFNVIHQEMKTEIRLVDLDCYLNEVLSNKAKDCFPIYLEIENDQDRENPFIVTGAVFYFPFVQSENTIPQVDKIHRHSGENRRFVTFWMGRWLPYEQFVPEFMQRPVKTSQAPKRCYDRAFGLLFVDRGIEPNPDKTRMDDSKTFKEMEKAFKSKDRKEAFDLWLKRCHHEYDEEVWFQGNDPKYLDDLKMSFHDKIILCQTEYQIGDHVEVYLENKETKTQMVAVGTIARFLQEEHFSKNKPKGEVELRVLNSRNAMHETKSFKFASHSFKKIRVREWNNHLAKNEKHLVKSIIIQFRQRDIQATDNFELPTLNCRNNSKTPITTNFPKVRVTLKASRGVHPEIFTITRPDSPWPNHVQKLLTVADSYTLHLQAEENELAFDCKSRTFRIVPAEVHEICFISDVSNFLLHVGEKVSIKFNVVDIFGNQIGLKAASHRIEVFLNEATAVPVEYAFDGTTVEIRDFSIACSVGKHQLKVLVKDSTIQKEIEKKIPITVRHGAPHSIQVDTELNEHVNYSSLKRTNACLQDICGNSCETVDGRLILTSPDLLFANNNHWESADVRKGLCWLENSCTSSLFSCVPRKEVRTDRDFSRFQDLLLKQETPIGVFHKDHGFLTVGDCVVLDTTQELAPGDPRKTRPKFSFYGRIESICYHLQKAEVGIIVKRFEKEPNNPRVLTPVEGSNELHPMAISSRCFIFHDSLRDKLDLDSLSDKVFFCHSDEFPTSLQATLDLLYESSNSLLHRRLSVPLRVSRTPRRFTLFRSSVELVGGPSNIEIKAEHGKEISDLHLVAKDEANQFCTASISGLSNLKVETSWMPGDLRTYRTAEEEDCLLPTLHVQSNNKHSISVFSCLADRRFSQEEKRLFHAEVTVKVIPGEPKILKMTSLYQSAKSIQVSHGIIPVLKAGDFYDLEATILDKNGYDIAPLNNVTLKQQMSFTFEPEDQSKPRDLFLYSNSGVLQGHDVFDNITFRGSTIQVRNFRILGKPCKGSLKLGLRIQVQTDSLLKTFDIRLSGHNVELVAGDPHAILWVKPDHQDRLALTVSSMVEEECDHKFYVADSSGNNLSSTWIHDLSMDIRGKKRILLEKISDPSHGQLYKLSTIPRLGAGEHYPSIVSGRVSSFKFAITVNPRNAVVSISLSFECTTQYLQVMAGSQAMAAEFAAKIDFHTEDKQPIQELLAEIPDVKLSCRGVTFPFHVTRRFNGRCLEVTFTCSEVGPHEISAEFVDSRPTYGRNKLKAGGRVVVNPGEKRTFCVHILF